MPLDTAGESRVVHIYVLGASSDPDHVGCVVPWEVDHQEIFFGPCKKSLRQRLRNTVLRGQDEVVPASDIFVIGVNALPTPHGPRKIVWAGRINKIMTFARAFDRLVGDRYEKMRKVDFSPLNVEPVRGPDGQLVGYQFRPNGDHPEEWHRDLVTTGRGTTLVGDRLLLNPGVSAGAAFVRDAVFTADNLFFARGKGLQIDDELVDILKQAQPAAEGVDQIGIFGRRSGVPDGLRGRFLSISEPGLVQRVLSYIRDRCPAPTMAVPATSAAASKTRSGGTCG